LRKTSFAVAALVALIVALIVLIGAASGGTNQSWAFGPFAGYIWRGHAASVQGSWTVPRVLAGSSLGSMAGTWIGAEAPGKPGPFIQIGTNEQHISPPQARRHVPDYYAFWSDTKREFHPQFLFRVSPGDDLRASLALAHKRWTLAIVDQTSGASAHFSTGDEAHGSFNEGEWTQEDVEATPGKLYPYPRLSEVGFRRLAINGSVPNYGEMYSTWMSVNGGYLAPTRLRGNSFTLRRATVSSTGAQYLHVSTPEDVASEAFVADFARWTAKTPYLQIESASLRFAAVLHSNIRALARAQWPTRVRGLIHSLIDDIQVLIEGSRPPAILSPAELAAWRSRWARDAQAVSNVAHVIKWTLNLPEIRPVT
jgi:hypothetical protein